jgi:hypothetical protein
MNSHEGQPRVGFIVLRIRDLHSRSAAQSLFLEYALSNSIAVFQLRRAVPLRGPYGMIGFFTVRSAVTLR